MSIISTANELQEQTIAPMIVTVPMTTSDISTQEQTQATDTMATSDISTQELPSALEFVVIKDYQTLEIALPIALITIILVAVIVALGVVLCLKARLGKRSSPRYENELFETSQTPLRPGTQILDNSALYGYSSPQYVHMTSYTLLTVLV